MQWEDFCMNLVELIDVSDDVLVSVTRHRGGDGRSRGWGEIAGFPRSAARRSLMARASAGARR